MAQFQVLTADLW